MHKMFAQLKGFAIYKSCDLHNGDGGCQNDYFLSYRYHQNYRSYTLLFNKKPRGTDGYDNGDGESHMDISLNDA